MRITSIEMLNETSLQDGNKIIGVPLEMQKSGITFNGKNNILFFDKGVKLHDSSIRFLGDNNIVLLSSSGSHKTKIKVDTYNNSIFYMGKNTNTTRPLTCILSEGKHIFIGNDCLFSLGIWMRNSDPHLIYSIDDHRRINPSKSIYIGDHVWIGQDVLITKGVKIGSGSIVGAKALVSGKTYPSNVSLGGVPAKILGTNIFWCKPSVHKYTEVETEKSHFFEKDDYIYQLSKETIQFDDIENYLNINRDVNKRFEYLKSLLLNKDNKNRFYIPIQNKKQSSLSESFWNKLRRFKK